MKKQHLLILSSVYTAFSCNQASSDEKQATEKPNIIFIMADDLGYSDLGCYGQQLIKTPKIDSMAAHGMKFTQCYSGASVCAPSRSVLMTGMHTGHTTVRGNFGKGGVVGLGGGEGRIPLKESDTTIAQVLKDAGYVTAMVGKWGVGEPNTSGEPYKKGFDKFYGFLNQRRAHTYFPEYIWKDTTKVMLEGNANGQKNDYTHELFMDYISNFLDENKENPFFLYIPFCLPHDEYEIPELGQYTDENWYDDAKNYAAMVSRLDRNVGRIMDKLKDLGLDKNTYVFFTSDNGVNGETDQLDIFDSSGPLRGAKRDAYEGGIRIPMIAYCPGKIQPGQSNDLVWYFADVMPTLTDLANTKAPVQIDGMSVLPTLKSEDQPEFEQRYLYWEFYERSGWRATRFGNWKAIQQDMYMEEPQSIELYNLADDIGETKDLSAQYPEVVKKAEKIFENAHKPSPYFMWKEDTKSENTL